MLDELDGDADLEPEVTEQDDEPETDDEPELYDHGGGNVEDEGESIEVEDAAGCGFYNIQGPDVQVGSKTKSFKVPTVHVTTPRERDQANHNSN